ncbi:glycoside hydrolase [Caloramator sp. E03]|uniref:glycoside hydrolase n=1 Tax=Caloramator sp. E03 TaxID=2576307 RepID=UPI001110E954|nr:glycoside hydrolase [Caloramator sp. E03]QCX34691.1 glycoside hydrolase [Caloramator sp. E03]
MKAYEFFSKKDFKKFIRGFFQVIILLFIFYKIVTALLTFNEYKEYSNVSMGSQGFIAISYFGVDRGESDTLISTKRLEDHLKALKDSGYVTITQQDIIDYYKKGKKLPQKSLFLIFEDGRRDTAIFAQKIMEKYNFKATMLTYADKFEKKDPKFLMPEDLLNMVKTTYWELGTNGYRLEYINVFDRYGNYIGEIDSLDFARLASYLDRNYNHYLMDYIRDKDGIPKESYNEMKKRIDNDYKAMKEIYTKEIGKLPGMYILMHSNTGQFGTNDRVSAVNEENIKKLFSMNFNREGNSFNSKNSSIYDLTRLQPQSYWPTNHLLMKIWDDTKQEVKFVLGDIEKADKWEMIDGKAEFRDNTIILTSMPKGRSIIRLKQQQKIKDIRLSVYLDGNKLGSQAIYVRADKDFNNYIFVQIKNNILYVKEKVTGVEKEIFSLNLDKLDGTKYQSIEENEKEARIAELKVELDNAETKEDKKEKIKAIEEKMKEKTRTVEEGAIAYIPKIQLKDHKSRYLELDVINNKISIYVDGKKVPTDFITKNLLEGAVCLESAWEEYGYSQRNLADDIYDGVFKNLVITDVLKDKIIFDNRLNGLHLILYSLNEKWENIINWFIKSL